MKPVAPQAQRDPTNVVTLSRSAPTTSDCQAAFQRIAKSCVKLMQHHRNAAIAGDPDAIHRMRIALTQLRAAVLFFSPMTDDGVWTEIDKELHWLNSALGKARDNDVTANFARRKRYRRWARSSLRAMVRAQREADRRLGKKLASTRYAHLMARVNHWIANGPWLINDRSVRSKNVATYAQARLRAWRVAISREGRHLRILHRKPLHVLRIQCKRYRYVTAALHSLGATITTQDLKFSETAKQVHAALGDLRDLTRLRKVAQRKPPGYRKNKRNLLQRAEKLFRRKR
jgi:CHAD domain-containing protein